MGHDPIPHPLAGRTGEGPPFAPLNWTWKAGQRMSDMYFCSPEGRRIRSQIQLQEYLSSIPNPPLFSQFCWRVTPEGVEAFSKKQQDQQRQHQQGQQQQQQWQQQWQQQRRKKSVENKSMDGQKSEDKDKGISSSPKRKQQLEHKEGVITSPDDNNSNNNKNAKRMKLDLSPAKHVHPISKPQEDPILPLTDATEHHHHNALSVIVHTVDAAVNPVAAGGKRRKKTEARLVGAMKHSFQSILSSPSSYKWLYNGNDVCRQFLEEAERLKAKSAAEKVQLRQLLLKREELEASNLAKYDTPVLRVFVSLLRNEDPPPELGKAELVSICVNWHCKHKHYWCVLETGRTRQQHLLTPPSPELTALPKLKLIGSAHEHECNWNGAVLALGPGGAAAAAARHVKEREVQHQYYYSDVVATHIDNPVSGGRTRADDDDDDNARYSTENKGEEEFTALSYFQNFKHEEESGLPAHFDLNGSLEIGKEDGGELLPLANASCQEDVHHASAEGAQADGCDNWKLRNVSTGGQADGCDNWKLRDGAGRQQQAHNYRAGLHDATMGFDFVRREAGTNGMAIVGNKEGGDCRGGGGGGGIEKDFPVPLCEPASSICLCRTCVNEPSFCRGCTCSFCKVSVWPDEKWKVLECAVCGHICHFLCAFNQQRAGVFKDSGLDSEWECPGCAHKCDLLPFWRKRVKSAVSYGQVEEIEKHLLLAVLALKDSEREAYRHLQCKVMEAHQLVQQGSPNTALFDLLQVIQAELNHLTDEEGTLTGEDAEWAQEALEMGLDCNWHDEERKIVTLQKEAKAEYEEWERAEKAAETQRTLLAEHIERADAEAKAHAQRATVLSLQAYKGRRRMQVIKLVQVKLGVTLEQVEQQRAEVRCLTAILQQLQHEVAYFQFRGTDEESELAFSKLLERLMAQREIIQSAHYKLDYMVSLYESR